MKLSANFNLSEFEWSFTAKRRGIDNTIPSDAKKNIKLLVKTILQPLRDNVGPVKITSGYRCLALNRVLKSKPTSAHVSGRAADIRIKGMTTLQVCKKIKAMGVPYDQLINEFGGWVHVSIAKPGTEPRYMDLTIDKFGTRKGIYGARLRAKV